MDGGADNNVTSTDAACDLLLLLLLLLTEWRPILKTMSPRASTGPSTVTCEDGVYLKQEMGWDAVYLLMQRDACRVTSGVFFNFTTTHTSKSASIGLRSHVATITFSRLPPVTFRSRTVVLNSTVRRRKVQNWRENCFENAAPDTMAHSPCSTNVT